MKKTIERCFHYMTEEDKLACDNDPNRNYFCKTSTCDGYDDKCIYHTVWHKEDKE